MDRHMQVLSREVGHVCFEVRSNISNILSIVGHALEDNGSATDAQAVVTICHSLASLQYAEDDSGPGKIVFPLKHVTYAYNPNQTLYNVCAGESARGIIDFRRSTAEWDVFQPMLPRSALHMLVLDPLSLLLPRYGVMICHGAAVVGKRGAVLFLGRSGSGKSTLGFLVSHENPNDGIQFMSDDTLALDFTGDIVRACPINSGFALTPELIKRFRLQAAVREALQCSRGKVYLPSVPCQSRRPQQVDRIILLEKCGDGCNGTEVSLLDRNKTLQALLDVQTTVASPYIVDRLVLLQRLAWQAPGVRLRYSTYCDLGVLRKVINEDLCEYDQLGERDER